MKRLINSIPSFIKFIILVYLLGLLFYFFYRAAFVFSSYSLIPQNSFEKLFDAFAVGLRFDTVVLSFILCVPFVILTLLNLLSVKRLFFYKVTKNIILFVIVLTFLICVADIPYFKYNFSRLTIAIFNWIDTPVMMLKMMFSEWSFILYFVLFVITVLIFIIIFNKISKQILIKNITTEKNNYKKLLLFFVLLSMLLFIGMRGRKASPIKEGHACVCDNAFINQIGLNPVFTFVKSFSNKIYFIDEKTAIKTVQNYFKIVNTNKYNSPVARDAIFDSTSQRMNVVLIIMESMTADNLKRFGNTENITPNIDSLAANGILFDNIWGAGKHTSNGIYSTLYSFPAIWSVRPTSNTMRTRYSGLPGILKQQGFYTIYFTNHSTSFDNIGEFIPENYFNKIISQGDYEQSKVVGMYGVPDHVMFDKGIDEINKINSLKKNFFVTFVTTSNHAPYIIPTDIKFSPKKNPIEKQIVEYADWSIGHFINLASKQSWFDSTIFVFIADHGAVTNNNKFIIPLSFHHIPLIIYQPKIYNSVKYEQIGGQIDVFPTVMSLLNIKYVNNTFGINLFKEKRPFIYFSEDNKLVCLNNDYMYVYTKEKEESLFKLKGNNQSNIFEKNKNIVDSLKNYMFSMLQVSQYMIEKKQTDVIKLK